MQIQLLKNKEAFWCFSNSDLRSTSRPSRPSRRRYRGRSRCQRRSNLHIPNHRMLLSILMFSLVHIITIQKSVDGFSEKRDYG
jgi:hypothetical protein